MTRTSRLSVLAAVAALACQDSGGPVAPEPAEESTVRGPAAAIAICPCWDERGLGTAFPMVHFYREADGASSLTRFDNANAQQIQALVRFGSDGQGACELAAFGIEGMVEALTAAAGLSEAQCVACDDLLEARAAATGFVIATVEGETVN